MTVHTFFKKFAAQTILVLFGFVILATSIYAQGKTAEAKTAKAPEVKQAAEDVGPYFEAGEDIVLEGTYNGPVFAAGRTVRVAESAVIDGDLIAAGGSVIVDGVVTQDIYAAGGTIALRGDVDGTMTVAGGEIQIEKTATVGRSLLAGGENVRIAGDVLGNVLAAVKRLEVSGMVGRDVRLTGEEVKLTETALISGNLLGEVSKSELATPSSVVGSSDLKITPHDDKPAKKESNLGWDIGKFIFSLTGKVIFIAIVSWLFGQHLVNVAKSLDKNWSRALGAGAALVVFAPLLAILLLITIFGSMAALSVLAGMGVFLMFGWLVVAQWLGMRVLPQKSARWQAVAGAAIVVVLTSLPIVGWLAGIVISVLGAGQLIITLRNK